MTRHGSSLLEARELTRYLPGARRDAASPIVDALSLSLQSGDVLGLLGLNGAGKSTTLRMLAGCLTPHAGSVHVAGHSMSDEPAAARAALGYLADRPPLYDDMRVEPYLRFTAALRNMPRRDINHAVQAVIEECQLADIARRRNGRLSKGQRQRVGIAQAIIHRPSVVLLDEPGSGLDPQQQDELRQLIRRLGHDRTVVFSTHVLSEVQACCTRIAVIHGGRLMAEHDLLAEPSARDELADLFHQIVSESASSAPAIDKNAA